MNLEPYTNVTVIPSRTKYQLKNFVIGQHDTPQMQWRQILIEAQQLAFNIRMAELDIDRKKIEIERLLSTGDPLDAVDAQEKQIGIVLTERLLAGARIEMTWLEEFAEDTGSFTVEEIENNQPEYWQKRLTRQANIDVYASQKAISQTNVQSMLNAGLLEQEQSCTITSGN